ncbi:MAG: hypothetical protein ABI723_20485 [Bacteroidia bacterium]
MKNRKVVVEIKNDTAMSILQNLEDVDLVKLHTTKTKLASKNDIQKLKPKRKSETESFFDLKGIWENRDINQESLRAKAWPKRNR